MSDAGKFVALAIPDAIEAGTKAAVNAGLLNESKPKKPRKPRIPGALPRQPNLQKETPAVTTASPQEIQKSLNAELEAYVDARPTAEGKAEALIKIGSYRVELQKYLPMLTDADEDLRNEVFGQWFQGGDVELRKMVFNAVAGSEELPLSKAAPVVGPVAELAKMVDATPEGPQRMAVLQKMGVYAQQVSDFWDRAEANQLPEANRTEAIEAWVNDGDRSHMEMKKAVAASEAQRRAAGQGVSHKDALAFTAGNASSNADSKLGGSGGSGTPDHGIRRTVPDGGGRMPGTQEAPGQGSADSPNPGSGPNDKPEGGGEASVAARLTRKDTTGNLGSVAGADGGKPNEPANDGEQDSDDEDSDTDYAQDSKRKKKAAKKSTLAGDLMKIMPKDFHTALAKYSQPQQQVIADIAANHAADLLAWNQKGGGQLQKRALDSAVTQWLSDDPDSVELKKFVAEALATAEQIPLELGRAIMAWEPERPKLTKFAVRQPYETKRAA